MAVAFPPLDIGWVAFFALVPLALVFRIGDRRKTLLAGATFGAVFFGLLLSWIRLFGLPAYAGIVILESTIFAVALSLASFARPALPPNLRFMAFALAILVGEYIRGHVPLGGFNWGGLAYSQHDNLSLLRLASFTGAWGLSFVVALVNASIAEMFKGSPRKFLVVVIVAAVGFPIVLPRGAANGSSATIGMIQGNAPEGTSDPNADDAVVFENHLDLTRMLDDPVDLVVWPESSLESDSGPETNFGGLQDVIIQTGAPFLVGATLVAQEEPVMKLQNASLFFSRDGVLQGQYVKRHLVPFGEFVPARRILEPVVKELAQVPFDLVAGNEATVFEIPKGRFASVICFESTFPSLVRSFVDRGARFLVVSTNNSSYGRTAASDQHVAFSQLRAAEHHMWVAHAALTGISAVVAPDGRVVGRTGLFRQAILKPKVSFAKGVTFYATVGDWFPLAGILVTILLMVLGMRHRRSVSPSEAMAQRPGKTLVVIPTYDEAENLSLVLDAVLNVAPQVDVLIVDDASGDGTGDIARDWSNRHSRVNLIERTGRLGLGRAYVVGFGWGLSRGYERFIEMDADLSHDPADLPRLLEGSETASVVIGSRYVPGGRVQGWKRGRHLLSRGGNLYARTMLGFNVMDATSGFRCYRREVLDAIGLENVLSDGYAFQIDMAYRAWFFGFKIVEIPITFREREAGYSKMSRRIVLEAIALVTLWGLRDRLFGRKSRLRP